MERLEPQWGRYKSSFRLIKEKKVTFEDDMLNMKTEMNHNLLTQTIEEIKRMEYSEKKVKVLTRVIEDLRNNRSKKGTIFAHRYFLHERFKEFGRERRDALTKYMDQIYRQNYFEPISI